MPDETATRQTQPETLQTGPDLRGVGVDDVGGKPAGEVFGSLSDVESGLIRYIDVELFGKDAVHVLVPIGHTRLTRETIAGTRLRLRAATREDLHAIPPMDAHTPPEEHHEREVLSALARLFHGESYYAHPAYDHTHLFAGDSPIVREEEAEAIEEKAAALAFLSRSAYRIADGEPDIRGWPVRTADAETGVVEDLVIDTEAAKVRYVVVNTASGDGSRRVLPIGYAELDLDLRAVRVPALSSDDLPEVPSIAEDGLDRDAETRILLHLAALQDGPRRFHRPDFRTPTGLDERST